MFVVDTPCTLVPGTVVSADTTTLGGWLNIPVGNVTAAVTVVLSAGGVRTTVPCAIFGIPDMDPSVLNVSGPQCPDPSPLTSNLSFVDFRVAGSAFGNVFVVGGE